MKLDLKNKTVNIDVFTYDDLSDDAKSKAVRHYLIKLENDDYEKYRNTNGNAVRSFLSQSDNYYLKDGTNYLDIFDALMDW